MGTYLTLGTQLAQRLPESFPHKLPSHWAPLVNTLTCLHPFSEKHTLEMSYFKGTSRKIHGVPQATTWPVDVPSPLGPVLMRVWFFPDVVRVPPLPDDPRATHLGW